MTMPSELMAWARQPGPRKVLAAARRRLENGHGADGSALRVSLSSAEREQIGELLGLRWTNSGRAPGIKALAGAVTDAGADLSELLAAIEGPLRDRPSERTDARHQADAERADAQAVLVAAGVPAQPAESWLSSRSSPRAGTGLLLDRAHEVAAVWRRLPTDGDSMLLAVLATEALDQPHCLDRGAALASAVLRIASPTQEPPADADDWRQAWEDLGIVCDPVSSRALVLNLPLTGTSAAARLAHAAPGEPVWLTWRSLNEPVGSTAPQVYVCENPSVVIEVANQLGQHSAPLICTNGRPSCATRRLLTDLHRDGVRHVLRADDDPAGQDIVAGLRNLLPGADLWRYTLRTRAAAAAAPQYEEHVIQDLVDDLRLATY
ncbi:TIGR02679 domain-containing protein [Kribbella sp. CA-294648]|uniref:TIGR02679 domain-containing protein n=1 Tax=Kribbella sp. CA-294648 TaxID=3239948 RepID=UPI003D94FD5C